jgi:probable rRNA maturation factor
MKVPMVEVKVDVDVSDAWDNSQNWQALAQRSVGAAFKASQFQADPHMSLSINFSDNDEVKALNAQWRGKDQPTNVLSFPMLDGTEINQLHGDRLQREVMLGDIILAHGICMAEAQDKDIPLPQHVTHLIVHGTLHLLGYDHIDDAQADYMEALEVKALASLGLANPYDDSAEIDGGSKAP